MLPAVHVWERVRIQSVSGLHLQVDSVLGMPVERCIVPAGHAVVAQHHIKDHSQHLRQAKHTPLRFSSLLPHWPHRRALRIHVRVSAPSFSASVPMHLGHH